MNETNYGVCQNYLAGYAGAIVGINPKTREPICRITSGIEKLLQTSLETLYSTTYTD